MDELKVPFYTYGNIYDQTDFQAIMDMFSTYDNNKKYKIRDEFEFECKNIKVSSRDEYRARVKYGR